MIDKIKVTVIGAGGKMGTRVTKQFDKVQGFRRTASCRNRRKPD